ncbi:lipoprotein [Streptomyces sudanensis]|uniref:lipoprotein n=1 Tax=Streptomyces sudanensis TaxID=436397 RepID=UPI0027E551FE|nr:lipoprotein [Streptomyces sudanensis]
MGAEGPSGRAVACGGRPRGGAGVKVTRGTGWGAVAVAAAALLSGCGPDGGPARAEGGAPAASAPASPTAPAVSGTPAAPASPAAPSAAAPAAPAPKGGTVGAAGSACPLPVTFDVAAGWEPKKVEPIDDPELAELNELLEQGPLTTVCEIDAKPAGQIGFLRVWTGDAGGATPRAALEAFVAADSAASVAYRDVRAGAGGALPATEATYVVTSELLDEPKPVHALAVATPRGPLVLELGGMDDVEHTAMLPAYELAKRSLAATGG